MRKFSHWTPRYIINRISTLIYEVRYPGRPWLTRQANEILDSLLKKSDIGLEFGSGRSTLWFASRISRLISVEDNETWANTVKETLAHAGVDNVDYKFRPRDSDQGDAAESGYVKIIDEFDDASIDFCLVDGIYRDILALKALSKIRPGGILVIDNVNWYLPSDSISPNSRSFIQGAENSIWKEVENKLTGWRKIWTSSGVTDTAIFIKPCS